MTSLNGTRNPTASNTHDLAPQFGRFSAYGLKPLGIHQSATRDQTSRISKGAHLVSRRHAVYQEKILVDPSNHPKLATFTHNGFPDLGLVHHLQDHREGDEKQKQLTGQDEPVKDGPTAQAQKHANEPITT